MRRFLSVGVVLASIVIMVSANTISTNVHLAPWAGPDGGVPAFDKMDLASIKEALETGMERSLKELDAVAKNPAPPTFENTIAAMERSGRDLSRVQVYWDIWGGNLPTQPFRDIQAEMAPKLAEYRSKITQNAAL